MLSSFFFRHSMHSIIKPFGIYSATEALAVLMTRRNRSNWKLAGACLHGTLHFSTYKPTQSSQKPISRFPIPDPESLPEDLQKLMNETEEKSGFVPNVFKTMSYRPDEMRAFVSYYNAVMQDREGGNINKIDKEMIIVAISSINKCRYCIVAHSALMRIFSKDPILADQVSANWETADLNGRQRAILEFASDIANCKPLKDKRFAALHSHGLTNDDAWDIGAVVALFSLSNRMAFLTSMVPNEEFYLMGRIPKSK